ncbi:response regulator [Salinihabitans flavidus]|nr:response regulator [Salinihabitans flavidus]
MALLMAGRPLPETLLIAFCLQMLSFGVVLVMGLLRTNGRDFTQPVATVVDFAPHETADIWRSYQSCGEAEESLRIALISPDMVQSGDIASNLAELGREVHHSTDREAMLESVQMQPDKWGLVIFDLESTSDAGIEDLVDFRAACPGIPVLLLSSAARRNSDHRPIGDATLCKPVFRTHLIEAIEAASRNSVAGH